MRIGRDYLGRALLTAALALTGMHLGAAHAAPPAAGEALVRTYCGGCHQPQDGGLARISKIRKTPEGWAMTLFRMHQVHGLALDESTRDAIVRYLSDTQGLAPSESAAGRFALERQPNAQDLDLGPEIGVVCGRCHSLARVALQRRDADEWVKLAHTHLGQWPSTEYQQAGRDREWWQLASVTLPPKLGELYPYRSAAWTAWQAKPAPQLSGDWVLVSHVPGGRDFYGSARIERTAEGDYLAHYKFTDASGFSFQGESKAIVYTGYEWRGTAQVGQRSVREVFAVSEDGSRISGRWFDAEHDDDGGEWTAVPATGPAQVLAVLPRALKAGATTTVTVLGRGLPATVAAGAFGAGTTTKVEQHDPEVLRLQVTASPGAVPGLRTAQLGATSAALALYARIDKVDVVPGYAIARLGGGRLAPVTAQFEALASTHLPDGEWLPLGPMAAEWVSAPFDEEAKRTEDPKFAGHFDPRGRFHPSAAGPNPAREFSGDNVGNLAVVARVAGEPAAVEGRAHLVVTVQRWNTPPIY